MGFPKFPPTFFSGKSQNIHYLPVTLVKKAYEFPNILPISLQIPKICPAFGQKKAWEYPICFIKKDKNLTAACEFLNMGIP